MKFIETANNKFYRNLFIKPKSLQADLHRKSEVAKLTNTLCYKCLLQLKQL